MTPSLLHFALFIGPMYNAFPFAHAARPVSDIAISRSVAPALAGRHGTDHDTAFVAREVRIIAAAKGHDYAAALRIAVVCMQNDLRDFAHLP
jgi:hypothetical protein